MILHSLKREFVGGVPFHYTFFEILNANRIISQRSLSRLPSDQSKSQEAICQMTFSTKFFNLCDYLCLLSSSIICFYSSEYAQKAEHSVVSNRIISQRNLSSLNLSWVKGTKVTFGISTGFPGGCRKYLWQYVELRLLDSSFAVFLPNIHFMRRLNPTYA